jgi:hypothetical protein
MGTGIVAIGLGLDDQALLSRILLGITSVAWVVLAASALRKAQVRMGLFREECCSPASLTGVAATAILGSAFTFQGWVEVGSGLLAAASLILAILVFPVLENWRTPTVGTSFLLAVAIESLAVLAAVQATPGRAIWLLPLATGAWLVGLAAYLVVLVRFDFRQLLYGRGDHWVSGGALAIATLAAGQVAQATGTLLTPDPFRVELRAAALALWIAAIVWLLLLVATELLRPRWGYDVLRWGTVFPVGMYGGCSLVVGTVEKLGPLVSFGRIWVWVGLGVWAIAFGALLGRASRVLFAVELERPDASQP